MITESGGFWLIAGAIAPCEEYSATRSSALFRQIVLIICFRRRRDLSPRKSSYRKTYTQILRGDLRHSLGLRKSDRAKQRSHIDLIDNQQPRGSFYASNQIGDLL